MIVNERFTLDNHFRRHLKSLEPKFGFGLLGAVVYYRTYSRLKTDGTQESWADTVIRVIDYLMSIAKWWCVSHRLPWNEEEWQNLAMEMADALFHMRFLAPGRGLWALSEYVMERGGLALNNCQYRNVSKLSYDASMLMDSLMCGVGTGFGAFGYDPTLYQPIQQPLTEFTYIIPDTREGWVKSLQLLIESYESPGQQKITFDYSQIRPAGSPIRGFGGVASGPEPLRTLHERVRKYLDEFVAGTTDKTRLVGDVVNAVGACVVAGNVRRSAELYLGEPGNATFLDLKNYEKHPERADIGWMSNNSFRLSEIDHFAFLPEIADRIRNNGEPGVINLLNIKKYGRYGEEIPDTAEGTNPCAEATLENAELCNLVEVFPTRCASPELFYRTVRLATIYSTIISLLPTHQEDTNAVVARNHRIGVSLSGIADWFDTEGASRIVTMMRRGYRIVEDTNQEFARRFGVPASIRTTVVKPSGTVSQLAGVSPGMHYPVFTRFIRRIRVGDNTPIVPLLQEAGVPYEPDAYSANTLVFEFPVEARARRNQRDVSMWHKGSMVMMLQRHWANQMVSNTITFDPKTEGHQIEDFLAFTVPFTKSLSLLPDGEEAAYSQMPYEAITKAEYDRRSKEIQAIDWSRFGGSDGQDSRFCSNDACEIEIPA